jgi:hypothetical protein
MEANDVMDASSEEGATPIPLFHIEYRSIVADTITPKVVNPIPIIL